jgi:hypothetical protein
MGSFAFGMGCGSRDAELRGVAGVDKATMELMFTAAAPVLALLTGTSRLHVQGVELYGCRMADSRGVLRFRFEADGMRSETDA